MATNSRLARVVVCDAGPLIHLDELGSLSLLCDFPAVLVPEVVWAEAQRHRPRIFDLPALIIVPARVHLVGCGERSEPHRTQAVVRFVPHRTLRPTDHRSSCS